MEFKKEFSYAPKVPFSYAHGGQEHYAAAIVIKGPTMTVGGHTMILGQQYAESEKRATAELLKALPENVKDALIEAQKSRPKEKASKSVALQAKPEQVIDTLMTGGADLDACIKAFVSILCSLDSKGKAFCVIDGQENMSRTIINDMNPNDVLAMMGEYIVNFIVASPTN